MTLIQACCLGSKPKSLSSLLPHLPTSSSFRKVVHKVLNTRIAEFANTVDTYETARLIRAISSGSTVFALLSLNFQQKTVWTDGFLNLAEVILLISLHSEGLR